MRSVFIVGNSIFAEGLTRTLTSSSVIEVIGSASTVEKALPLLQANCPDAVIVADTGEVTIATFGPILDSYSNLPIIHANSDADSVHVITSQHIGTRSSDLFAAIAALPKK